jgi:hypothetical protein
MRNLNKAIRIAERENVDYQDRITGMQEAYRATPHPSNKSPGPDLIPNKILKMFAFELAPVIADVYNSSLSQGVVPSQLKLSIVRPIPKVLPPTSIENDLRPISLTSQISKIMERFTINSLMPQVIDQLDPKQFALIALRCWFTFMSMLAPMRSTSCSN